MMSASATAELWRNPWRAFQLAGAQQYARSRAMKTAPVMGLLHNSQTSRPRCASTAGLTEITTGLVGALAGPVGGLGGGRVAKDMERRPATKD